MKIICQTCNKEIAAAHIKLEDETAYCQDCNITFDMFHRKAVEESRKKIGKPQGIHRKEREDGFPVPPFACI